MSAIESIKALEIIDSRGNPTVWAEITTVTGAKASAAVPSGASTGEREAIELRDEDPARYGGKGVLRAVANINNEIADALNGFPVEEQAGIDQTMIDLDGTSSKRLLGANAMLAVSIAASRTAALEQRIPIYSYLNQGCDFQMPVPMMNIINGGV
ncbi:MAG TPA: phosphopyruvate hydratase, partial [Gammaproteobacteria bacterium]|nr:phosphopyruvate hydratase [Gammaproteobacteria bacterium]